MNVSQRRPLEDGSFVSEKGQRDVPSHVLEHKGGPGGGGDMRCADRLGDWESAEETSIGRSLDQILGPWCMGQDR